MEDLLVVILGVPYKIHFVSKDEIPEDDGQCNFYSKEIFIRKPEDLFESDNTVDCNCRKKRLHEVIRHELVHAFLFESGLDVKYNEDEVLVDWIAKQLPKINNAFDDIMGGI